MNIALFMHGLSVYTNKSTFAGLFKYSVLLSVCRGGQILDFWFLTWKTSIQFKANSAFAAGQQYLCPCSNRSFHEMSSHSVLMCQQVSDILIVTVRYCASNEAVENCSDSTASWNVFQQLHMVVQVLLGCWERHLEVIWSILLHKQASQSQFSGTVFRWTLNISKNEDSTVFLGSQFQCSITLAVKNV